MTDDQFATVYTPGYGTTDHLNNWPQFACYFIAVCEAGGGTPDVAAENSANVQAGVDYWTIGFCQWMGAAGGRLLQYIRARGLQYGSSGQLFPEVEEAYDALPSRWREYVEANNFAAFQYLDFPTSEANQWRDACRSAQTVIGNTEASYFKGVTISNISGNSSLSLSPKGETWNGALYDGGYDNVMSFHYYGMTFTHIKTLIYYLGVWWAGPAWAVNLYNKCGDTEDLDVLCDTTIGIFKGLSNWATFGEGWTNRYGRGGIAYRLLTEWDGESSPGNVQDWAGIGEDGQGNQNTTADDVYTGPNSGIDRIKYIYTNGQDLFVVTNQNDTVHCVQANADNVWIPYTNGTLSNPSAAGTTAGTHPAGTYTVPSTGWKYAQSAYDDLKAQEGTWTYDQDYHSNDPWVYKRNDCSGMCWWVINRYDTACADYYRQPGGAPGYTGTFYEKSATPIAEGLSDTRPDESLMKPGDLVMYNYKNAAYTSAGGDSGMHMGMYFGNDTVIHTGLTSPPREVTLTQFLASALWWCVLRPPYSETE